MKRLIAILALALAGCSVASPVYVKADATPDQQRQQEATCRMEARRLGATAQEPNALVAMGMQERQYEDCMVSAGYVEAR